MAVHYTNINRFVADVEEYLEIDEVLEEDMSTYDTPMPQQYYFMLNDKMVAHWSPSGKIGAIIGPRSSSQWSTKYRKFKKMSLEQFKRKFGVK